VERSLVIATLFGYLFLINFFIKNITNSRLKHVLKNDNILKETCITIHASFEIL